MHRSSILGTARFWPGLAAALLAVGPGFCLSLSSAYAADPAKPYLGMSKDEIIACAGEPHGKYKRGANGETLTYKYSGAGPVPGQPGEKKKGEKTKSALSAFIGKDKDKDKNKKKDGKDWTCTASLVFESGRLVRVSFAHKDVRSPYDWQGEKNPKKREAYRTQPVPTCSFSLPNCAR